MKRNVEAILLVLVLVLVRALFLLSNMGLINVNLVDLRKTWRPMNLILAGLALLITPGETKKGFTP